MSQEQDKDGRLRLCLTLPGWAEQAADLGLHKTLEEQSPATQAVSLGAGPAAVPTDWNFPYL